MDIHDAERILEIAGTYTMSDAKKAYRRQALKQHPDYSMNAGLGHRESTRRMVLINDAYQFIREAFAVTGRTSFVSLYHPKSIKMNEKIEFEFDTNADGDTVFAPWMQADPADDSSADREAEFEKAREELNRRMSAVGSVYQDIESYFDDIEKGFW